MRLNICHVNTVRIEDSQRCMVQLEICYDTICYSPFVKDSNSFAEDHLISYLNIRLQISTYCFGLYLLLLKTHQKINISIERQLF